jgi:hypothetical protein
VPSAPALGLPADTAVTPVDRRPRGVLPLDLPDFTGREHVRYGGRGPGEDGMRPTAVRLSAPLGHRGGSGRLAAQDRLVELRSVCR